VADAEWRDGLTNESDGLSEDSVMGTRWWSDQQS